ncbi:MAG: hypothetical protein COV74_03975 [Candidatus Omnitrophica bacterium CG11_big_fil_rev_8_21_14_0_20_45_26]|uniref:4Fe-4S ferredoxin-type domain-containing protein n=1 Tax=Candidatus Abzuiibacterium crystallinum TaxID=1974748 RepID=A0A2H0LQK6_9BACT|nr:MAG: hypothetical protein COV74_03975 [Candidatus Omnitrophica bacterium CG11_big_fil_rev_8_21_14_0_20_45_26]PIW63284.1 MAG: hypothetical protein COW12_10935 [Candidatus Omnitrophica bacterium CG12_big_fil_rev_8_21_14_0_65_45_16]
MFASDISSSRRRFLKGAGASVCALSIFPKKLRANHTKVSKGEAYSVLVDLTRCIACRACSRVCVKANGLDPADDGSNVSPQHCETLAYNKWSTVNVENVPEPMHKSLAVGVKRQCMHCLEPACVSVCPVGAFSQTEKGPVIYRSQRCIGCRYCMIACPFEIPKFNWHSGFTPVVGKCQFCAQNRLFKGLPPACVEACPTGALKFGSREKLLFEAKVRVKANPKKYIKHIYGENEIGGTSWLYLSGIPFEKLGFKSNLPTSPIPSFTWEVVSRIPIIIAALSGLFGMVAFSLKKHIKDQDDLPKAGAS